MVFAAAVLALDGCASLRGGMHAPSDLRTDCATAAVVGLHWRAAPDGPRAAAYRVLRDGRVLATVHAPSFADTTVAPEATYRYSVASIDSAGNAPASEPLVVATPAASVRGDAPYCPSRTVVSMSWDWQHGYRAAIGSDLWPVTWGRDGNVYAFFGDGGGFGGDDHLGRASFGIAMISGRPPLSPAVEANVYGGYQARRPSLLSGKARSIIAVGGDFYAIAGIYREGDAKYHDRPPISGSPDHIEIAYSRHDAASWQEDGWTFCGSPSTAGRDAFCPSGFINHGRGGAGSPGRYVYVLGSSPAADERRRAEPPAARTYLARVPRGGILRRSAYRFFSGLNSRGKPTWSADPDRMEPVFTDRSPPQAGCGGQCVMAGSLEDAVYDFALKRYIGVAQGDYLAQTSFYESEHPWGPWSTIAYDNIDPADGGGGWGNLGAAAGGSLGVHAVNAWTSADGRTLWMMYSSDGVAPPGALFPPAGSKLDALQLVRVDLEVASK
ncbi:MAG TPA: hypothetical protein VHV81_02325 [Steroidobacteraceae bacterium]|nr:hypothetical protein [Steroidobacteraceae bacterium]